MSETHNVLERVTRVIQMSRIAWLRPRIRIDFTHSNHLEIYICVGVVPDFKPGRKISVHLLEAKSVSSLQMWEDLAIDDEFLMRYIENEVSDLGMGVMLLEEGPSVHFELYSREEVDG